MTNYSQSMRDALELVYTRNQEKIAELNEKMSSAQIAKLKKAYEPMRNKRISTSNADKLSKLMDKVGKDKEVLIQIVKADIPFVSQSAVTKLITKHNMKGAEINKFKEEFNIESVELDEEAELDEGKMKEIVTDVEDAMGKIRYKLVQKGGKFNVKVSKNDERDAQKAMKMHPLYVAGKLRVVPEEADLDEKKVDHQLKIAIDTVKNPLKGKFLGGPSAKEAEKTLRTKYKYTDKMIAKLKEETELDEAKKVTKKERDRLEDQNEHGLLALKLTQAYGTPAEVKKIKAINKRHEQKGSIERKDQKERDAISNKYYKMAEESEVEEAYEYGTTEYANHTKEVTPGQEVDEASARADAKRSMRRDPSMRKQSPFSKDVSATDDDVKAASKNIIMQMRKAVSLRGKFPVEFADKKKIKIPADIAQAVQQKYNSFKKPADKEKFQAKVGKSYKDMLRALREEVQEEKTILDRIEEIIKENKNG
tara:strand:+ start:1256 stop:2692 length:1437 start_codon:yes stop_codon:yes gene_type:complete